MASEICFLGDQGGEGVRVGISEEEPALKMSTELEGEKGPPSSPRGALSPSLSISHNCIETVNFLQGSHKKSAEAMAYNIKGLARSYGIERIGFLTLTFADNVNSIKTARKRFHSLVTNVLQKRYRKSIAVVERQESGRIHFHLVVVCAEDIRTGVDFEQIEKRNYTSAGRYLRSEWAFWRSTAPKFRFGRTELLPIRSTAEGIARYVGSYISAHIRQREYRDLGARLVSYIGYSRDEVRASAKFTYVTVNSWLWRKKLEAYCTQYDMDMDSMKKMHGPRWCYKLQAEVIGIDLVQHYGTMTYPTGWHAVADGHALPNDWKEVDMESPVTVNTTPETAVDDPVIGFEERVLLLQCRYEMEESERKSRQMQRSKEFDEVVEDYYKIKLTQLNET